MPKPAGTPKHVDLERKQRLDAWVRVHERLTLDVGRGARTGVPEVVLAEGKVPSDVVDAARALLDAAGLAIISRCPPELDLSPLGVPIERYACGIVVARDPKVEAPSKHGRVAILTGGASDVRVAEEAQVVAQAIGCEVRLVQDVGVASLARALASIEDLLDWRPHAWIVVAGREGALAPVVAGLVPGPVIGVPVSTGYGWRGRGEAALSTMLQSCAPLVTVNIDAGFVAGAAAAQIARRADPRFSRPSR